MIAVDPRREFNGGASRAKIRIYERDVFVETVDYPDLTSPEGEIVSETERQIPCRYAEYGRKAGWTPQRILGTFFGVRL